MSSLANTMPVTEATPFDCPNCGAQYKLVRVETNETLPDQQLACRKCGGPLHGHQGRSSPWMRRALKRSCGIPQCSASSSQNRPFVFTSERGRAVHHCRLRPHDRAHRVQPLGLVVGSRSHSSQ